MSIRSLPLIQWASVRWNWPGSLHKIEMAQSSSEYNIFGPLNSLVLASQELMWEAKLEVIPSFDLIQFFL